MSTIKEPTNHERAQNAEFAVKTYILMRGEDGREITEEDITDLMTDLLHLAEYLKLPRSLIIANTLTNFNAEKE